MKLKGHFRKVQSLRPYDKKQIPKKVRKYFMTDKEFLTIWELFKNIKTEEDKVFWINLVETSKTYKHYKKNPISFYMDNQCDNSVEQIFNALKKDLQMSLTCCWVLMLLYNGYLLVQYIQAPWGWLVSPSKNKPATRFICFETP